MSCRKGVRSALRACLRGSAGRGQVAAEGTLSGSNPVNALRVADIGVLSWPLPAAQWVELQRLATAAPFGRREQTLHDDAVRRTLQIDASQLQLGPRFQSLIEQRVVPALCEGLGVAAAQRKHVHAHLYKLLLYRPGDHFAKHRDSEKLPGMFATLSLLLPCSYTGGELTVSFNHKKLVLGRPPTDDDEASELRWIAFYCDVEHQVAPVQSGLRIALTFNVAYTPPRQKERGVMKSDDAPRAPSEDDQGRRLRRLARALERWVQTLHPPVLVLPLAHQYSRANGQLANLKGQDRAVYQALQAAVEILREAQAAESVAEQVQEDSTTATAAAAAATPTAAASKRQKRAKASAASPSDAAAAAAAAAPSASISTAPATSSTGRGASARSFTAAVLAPVSFDLAAMEVRQSGYPDGGYDDDDWETMEVTDSILSLEPLDAESPLHACACTAPDLEDPFSRSYSSLSSSGRKVYGAESWLLRALDADGKEQADDASDDDDEDDDEPGFDALPWDDGETTESTGNEGASSERWYNRTALVLTTPRTGPMLVFQNNAKDACTHLCRKLDAVTDELQQGSRSATAAAASKAVSPKRSTLLAEAHLWLSSGPTAEHLQRLSAEGALALVQSLQAMRAALQTARQQQEAVSSLPSSAGSLAGSDPSLVALSELEERTSETEGVIRDAKHWSLLLLSDSNAGGAAETKLFQVLSSLHAQQGEAQLLRFWRRLVSLAVEQRKWRAIISLARVPFDQGHATDTQASMRKRKADGSEQQPPSLQQELLVATSRAIVSAGTGVKSDEAAAAPLSTDAQLERLFAPPAPSYSYGSNRYGYGSYYSTSFSPSSSSSSSSDDPPSDVTLLSVLEFLLSVPADAGVTDGAPNWPQVASQLTERWVQRLCGKLRDLRTSLAKRVAHATDVVVPKLRQLASAGQPGNSALPASLLTASSAALEALLMQVQLQTTSVPASSWSLAPVLAALMPERGVSGCILSGSSSGNCTECAQLRAFLISDVRQSRVQVTNAAASHLSRACQVLNQLSNSGGGPEWLSSGVAHVKYARNSSVDITKKQQWAPYAQKMLERMRTAYMTWQKVVQQMISRQHAQEPGAAHAPAAAAAAAAADVSAAAGASAEDDVAATPAKRARK